MAFTQANSALAERKFVIACAILSRRADVLLAVDGRGLVALCEISGSRIVKVHIGETSEFKATTMSDKNAASRLIVRHRDRDFTIELLTARPDELAGDLAVERVVLAWWRAAISGAGVIANYPLAHTTGFLSHGPLAEQAEQRALRDLNNEPLPVARASFRRAGDHESE